MKRLFLNQIPNVKISYLCSKSNLIMTKMKFRTIRIPGVLIDLARSLRSRIILTSCSFSHKHLKYQTTLLS